MEGMVFFGLLFGFITLIVLGSVAIETWGKVERARVKGGDRILERLDRLEAELEELRDQVAELMIEAHDGALLRGEEEGARLRARSR